MVLLPFLSFCFWKSLEFDHLGLHFLKQNGPLASAIHDRLFFLRRVICIPNLKAAELFNYQSISLHQPPKIMNGLILLHYGFKFHQCTVHEVAL